MLRCILFLTVLLASPVFAQMADTTPQTDPAAQRDPGAQPDAPAEPTDQPDASAAASQSAPWTAPTTPQMTPEQLLTQYRHDQINLLALQAKPESLLGAVFLAGADADDKKRLTGLKSPALLQRAQTLGADNALVWWVTAGTECRGTTHNCPQVETLQKLESLDAENAAVWALSLWHAQQAKDEPAARAALASAAQAKRYDDYFGALIIVIFDAEGILPMSDELLKATRQQASVRGFRLTTAAAMAAAMVLPGYRATAVACKTADRSDAALIEDCVAVAKKMEMSGGFTSRNSGIGLLESLLPPGPELDAAHAQARSLAWQTMRISELGGRLADDDSLSRVYMQALAESGNESAAVFAVLRSQGVSIEPPADWQPPEPAATPNP